jgi:hypothetical protein
VTPERALLLSFAAGNVAYLYRHWLPHNRLLFLACLVAAYFTLGTSSLSSVSVLLVTYCTVWVGLTPLPLIPLARYGDYSYGIYLYGYPVQQSMAYLFPELRTPLLNVVASLPVILTLAAVSWHLIEKRALRLRSLLPKRPDVAGMAWETRAMLLTTLFLYEAFLNVGVLDLDRGIAAIANAILLSAVVLAGLATLLWTRRSQARAMAMLVLRLKLGSGRVRSGVPREEVARAPDKVFS